MRVKSCFHHLHLIFFFQLRIQIMMAYFPMHPIHPQRIGFPALPGLENCLYGLQVGWLVAWLVYRCRMVVWWLNPSIILKLTVYARCARIYAPPFPVLQYICMYLHTHHPPSCFPRISSISLSHSFFPPSLSH